MSEDTPTPPKRRIVVRITARDKQDPAALLAAVRNSLSGHGISLVCMTVGEAESASPIGGDLQLKPLMRVVKDEALETKARELIGAALDAAEADLEKKIATAKRDAAIKDTEVVAARKGLQAYVAFLIGQGIRISLEVNQP
jgi:hypothetical protein